MSSAFVTPSCYYATWGGYALGWTHFLPTVMTLFFSVVSVIYSEFFFLIVGLYFKGASYILSIAQMHLEVMRPDPYCAVYHTFAYPSMETFYCIALLTFLFTYVFTDSRPCQVGVYGWICALTVAFLPPFMLYYNNMNTWQEILSTMVIAIVPTVLFMLFLRFVIQPNMAYLIVSPPLNWFGYQSHFLPTDPEELELAIWAKNWRENFNFSTKKKGRYQNGQ